MSQKQNQANERDSHRVQFLDKKTGQFSRTAPS
jgi:hypothetical protein